MREIKFRVWYPELKTDIGINFYKHMKYCETIQELNSAITTNGRDLITREYIIMGYIGLKDKNGKEIYEGDIVSMDRGQIIGEVIYKDLGYIIKVLKKGGCCYYQKYSHLMKKSVEVIGNIFEKPDILKDGKYFKY